MGIFTHEDDISSLKDVGISVSRELLRYITLMNSSLNGHENFLFVGFALKLDIDNFLVQMEGGKIDFERFQEFHVATSPHTASERRAGRV